MYLTIYSFLYLTHSSLNNVYTITMTTEMIENSVKFFAWAFHEFPYHSFFFNFAYI